MNSDLSSGVNYNFNSSTAGNIGPGSDSQNMNGSQVNGISSIGNRIDNLTINTPNDSNATNMQRNKLGSSMEGLTAGPIRASDKLLSDKKGDLGRSNPYSERKVQQSSGVGESGQQASMITTQSGLGSNRDFDKPGALPHLFRSFRAAKFCKRCGAGNSIVVYDSKSGSEICTRCGVVVEDRVINEEQEWRSFSNDGNDGNSKSRIGSVNDVWLDDGTDSQLLVGDKKLMKAMLKHNTQASSDRMIKEVFNQLRQIANSFSLHDNIIERCKEIVKEQSNLNILKSGKKNVLAIVYLACREEGVSRTVKELLSFDRTISERELVRSINKLKKDLPRRGPTLSSSAAELMPRFCHYLQLSHEIVGIAEYVCRTAEQYINKSHRPNSLAAGAIYFVCNLCNIQIEMKSVAVAAKSGETTVRGVYKELLLVGEKLLPSDFTPKLVGGIDTLKRRSKIFE
ncbi:transcription initiation factor TFIIB [Cryptosporidium ubiquitum]|uniref:General transcription factor TFIIB n=1 Tax=Cryptosporidium ubiquitum TaxID=857276 RepID=A0A1J4MED7_9CRYT|nr:transcription initiation factor TFIIB [Cryptosporidium ubiquitum]OII72577.1 transcription initiation factor TFIIB [Cryptosporidium ubiquitum]